MTDDCSSFCHPSFNHHSFNPHDSESMLQFMMDGNWHSHGTALMMPVHTDEYQPFKDHCNASFDMTSDVSKHRELLKDIKDEKNRFFMENTNINKVQKFVLSNTDTNDSNDKGVGQDESVSQVVETNENSTSMLKWRLLTEQEYQVFVNTLLPMMSGINFFDVKKREEFCVMYNECNTTTTQIYNDSTDGMKGYINFMISFQKVIKIRFGIIDGLHRLSVYMKYLESFNTKDKLPHMIHVNVGIMNVIYDKTRVENGQDYYSDVIEKVKMISKEVCVNNNKVKNISCGDIINNLINEYESKFNGLPIGATIKQWSTGPFRDDTKVRWASNFQYDFKQLAMYQFVTGYNFMMSLLVTSEALSLSEPFNSECTRLQQYVKRNEVSTLSLPFMDKTYSKIAYSLYKKVLGDKIPTFDQFSCNEIWTIPKSNHRSNDAVKFRQAFRIDPYNCRLYNVEKEWQNSDRSGEEIIDFEVLKEQLKAKWYKENSPFIDVFKDKGKSGKVQVFSCGDWLKGASTSVTMIQTSKMIHNNPDLRALWNKVITDKHEPKYDQLVTGSPNFLSGNDIGSITTIATMISNFMFGSFLPFGNKLPNIQATPKYNKLKVYAIDDVVLGQTRLKKGGMKPQLRHFDSLKQLLKDQLCAFMMHQFFEAYSKFGSNPDIVKDMTDKHGICACQFLLEFRSDGCKDDNDHTNITHIKEHVKKLFDEEPLKLDQVITGLDSLEPTFKQVRKMMTSHDVVPMQPTIFGSLLLMYYKWLHNACAMGVLKKFTFNVNVQKFLIDPKKFLLENENVVFQEIKDSNFLGDKYSFNTFYEQLSGKDNILHLDAFTPLTVDEMVEKGKDDLCLLHERF